MKVYLPKHRGGAGLPIYTGYFNAWEKLGFDSEWYIDSIPKGRPKEYYAMTREDILLSLPQKDCSEFVEDSKASFIFTPSNYYPKPWGEHCNWVSRPPEDYVKFIENIDHAHLWSFGNFKNAKEDFYPSWKKDVSYIPLAFDDGMYNRIAKKDTKYKFDICFIGGWADNGFDEKRKIMIEHFSFFNNEFEKLGLKSGISIGQNIPTEDEAGILFSSKIAINLHDAYQRVLGYDSNERTFKSLGLNGFLICDRVKEVENLFPLVPTASNPQEFLAQIKIYLDKSDENMKELKDINKQDIMDNHTYVNRVKQMLEL